MNLHEAIDLLTEQDFEVSFLKNTWTDFGETGRKTRVHWCRISWPQQKRKSCHGFTIEEAFNNTLKEVPILGDKPFVERPGTAGGSITSLAKKRAAQTNGAKGGRPKKLGDDYEVTRYTQEAFDALPTYKSMSDSPPQKIGTRWKVQEDGTWYDREWMRGDRPGYFTLKTRRVEIIG